MKYATPNRKAFTLIELMVAAALSLVIMTVLALAFQSGMATMSSLKATGDEADRLRTAEVMLRADLDADHIVGDDGGTTLKVSDLRFDTNPALKPIGGYFIVSTTAGVNEGTDANTVVSTRMNPTANDYLFMTVKRTGKTPNDFFIAKKFLPTPTTDTVGATNDGFPWAEVKWQLANPNTIGGVTTYSLHRLVRELGFASTTSFPKTSPNLGGLSPAGPSDPSYGDDIVLTNVLSFEVKPLLTINGAPTAAGLDTPYSDTSFDTAAPAGRRCVAVLVKLRLFDVKSRQTRQMSLIVKL